MTKEVGSAANIAFRRLPDGLIAETDLESFLRGFEKGVEWARGVQDTVPNLKQIALKECLIEVLPDALNALGIDYRSLQTNKDK